MICLSYYEAYNEKSRIEKQGGRAVMKKRWYGWSVTEWISQEIDQMDTFLLCITTFCIGYGLAGLWLAFKDSDK